MGTIDYLPHTADATVEVTADSREELFALGARALYTQMLEYDAVVGRDERRVEMTGANLSELFHAWLSELLYIVAAETWVAKRFAFAFEGDKKLVATLVGEGLDTTRHAPHGEVKSVTYNDYVFEKRPEGGYFARVTFDL